MSLRGRVPNNANYSQSKSSYANAMIEFNEKRMSQTYAFPAKFVEAEIHDMATTFGYNSLLDN